MTGCEWFTFYQKMETCVGLTGCIRLEPINEMDKIISGERECPEYHCEEQGMCLGALEGILNLFSIHLLMFSSGLMKTDNISSCHTKCTKHNRCFWATYNTNNNICLLTNDCPAMDKACKNCTAMEKGCWKEGTNDVEGINISSISTIE